jgi:CHAD domain-containing protein
MSLPRPLRDLRLRRQRPVGQALAQWCTRLARHASAQGRRNSRDLAIHQLRLVGKALRAALRLADEGDPAPDLLELDQSIRATAAAIAGSRDAVVLSRLLGRLAEEASPEVQAAAAALGTQWTTQATTSGDIVRAADSLVELAGRLGSELAERVNADGIADCLRRSLQKVARHQRRARRSGKMESFHAWRRWQKRLEAQLRLTSPPSGKAFDRRMDRIHRLQELLGSLHDVDLLFLRLSQKGVVRGVPVKVRKELIRLVTARQDRLRKKSLRRGAAVLDGKARKALLAVARKWETRPS